MSDTRNIKQCGKCTPHQTLSTILLFVIVDPYSYFNLYMIDLSFHCNKEKGPKLVLFFCFIDNLIAAKLIV